MVKIETDLYYERKTQKNIIIYFKKYFKIPIYQNCMQRTCSPLNFVFSWLLKTCSLIEALEHNHIQANLLDITLYLPGSIGNIIPRSRTAQLGRQCAALRLLGSIYSGKSNITSPVNQINFLSRVKITRAWHLELPLESEKTEKGFFPCHRDHLIIILFCF